MMITLGCTSTTKTETKSNNLLQVQEGYKWSVDIYGISKINGSVKNIGNKAVKYFEVTVEYLNGDGKIIDKAYKDSNERVNPGNEKEFEIMNKHNPDFKSSRLFVNHEITD